MAGRRPVWCSTFWNWNGRTSTSTERAPPAPISPEIVPEIVPHARFRNCRTVMTFGTVVGVDDERRRSTGGLEVGYCRVSTTKQSLDRQFDALAAAGIPAIGSTATRRPAPPSTAQA